MKSAIASEPRAVRIERTTLGDVAKVSSYSGRTVTIRREFGESSSDFRQRIRDIVKGK